MYSDYYAYESIKELGLQNGGAAAAGFGYGSHSPADAALVQLVSATPATLRPMIANSLGKGIQRLEALYQKVRQTAEGMGNALVKDTGKLADNTANLRTWAEKMVG